MSRTGVLPPEHRVVEWRELCLFLGGDVTSFTGHLLHLIQKADMTNTHRLRIAFPREVTALALWQITDGGCTAGELADRIDLALEQNAALTEALQDDAELDEGLARRMIDDELDGRIERGADRD